MTALQREQELTYNARRLCELTGATYRQIDHWCRLGLIPESANGSGSRREFTVAELDLIHAVMGLLRFGVNPRRAFDIARRLPADEIVTARIADIYDLSITITGRTAQPNPTTGGSE